MKRFAYRVAASGHIRLLHDREFGIWWVKVWDACNAWWTLSQLESGPTSLVSTVFNQQAEKQWEELIRRYDEGEEFDPRNDTGKTQETRDAAILPLKQHMRHLEDTVAEKNTKIDELELERDAMWAFALDLRRQLNEARQG